MIPSPTARAVPAPAVRRLALVLAVITVVAGALATDVVGATEGRRFPGATPTATCDGPRDRLEPGRQGRVPLSEYTSGRYRQGYRCNTVQVAHQGTSGGFKVIRYTDSRGRRCAYYDSTLLFPRDTLFNAVQGLGVITLDMAAPRRPRQTATLTTPAMQSPHESLLVNRKRGILAAVLGNPATNIGIVDLYDVRTDCRRPRLLSSTRSAPFGHESGMAPDGRTFWVAGTAGGNLTAIDISDPRNPRTIFDQRGVRYHGLRLSGDGRTLYVADTGTGNGPAEFTGVRLLDVSEVQDRKDDPEVRQISTISWSEVSIPQVAEPFVRDGRQYLLETDEFATFDGNDSVGGARIIDITRPRTPKVVSHLRLAVHQPANRASQRTDPGSQIPVQGYAAHYCSVPYRDNPQIVACSMIVSGLRLFDISDLRRPVEVGYFNRPVVPAADGPNPTALGGFAMSQPAWDVPKRHVWYSDGNSGFYVVGLTGRAAALLRR